VKLLVLAPVPPPFHGQSYMVALMLDRLGGDRRGQPAADTGTGAIEVYHVNSPLSPHLGALGGFSLRKILLAVRYLVEVLWCRFRYGARTLYYVPATGMRTQIYRDWFLFGLSRVFFRRTILHWHGLGLREFLHTPGRRFERAMTWLALGRVDLSIVLAPEYAEEVRWLAPCRVAAVPNGIPDPCPNYTDTLAPERATRARRLDAALATGGSATRSTALPVVFRVLYLGHCSEDKGLFDVVEAVALVKTALRHSEAPVEIRLSVAGDFMSAAEHARFERRIGEEDLREPSEGQSCVRFGGFVSGAAKDRLLRDSDCLCFPSYYRTEAHPVALVEGLAYGLEIVVSRWRALPTLVPREAEVVDIRSPAQIAHALHRVMGRGNAPAMRDHFLSHYEVARTAAHLEEALLGASP
jgi:glycosyltransferase involved in cell wall biosynthesis